MIRAAIAVPLAILSAAVDWSGWLMALLFVLMALDWLTSLWHKAGTFVAVIAAFALDVTAALVTAHFPQIGFEYKAAVLLLVCVWYILTELGSIIENADKLGAPIPHFLRRMIAALKKSVDGDGCRSAGAENRQRLTHKGRVTFSG